MEAQFPTQSDLDNETNFQLEYELNLVLKMWNQLTLDTHTP